MTIIRHKWSQTTGHKPSSLAAGEIAFNEIDGKIFYRNPAGNVAIMGIGDPLKLLAEGTVTNAANLTFDVDPASIGTFRGFIINCIEGRGASDTQLLFVRLGDSGGIKTTGYRYVSVWMDYTAAPQYRYSDSGSGINAGESAGSGNAEGFQGIIYVGTNDNAQQRNRVMAQFETIDTVTSERWNMAAGGYDTANMYLTDIQLLMSSGNIATMRYQLLGIT